jgi:hypothetical protein
MYVQATHAALLQLLVASAGKVAPKIRPDIPETVLEDKSLTDS